MKSNFVNKIYYYLLLLIIIVLLSINLFEFIGNGLTFAISPIIIQISILWIILSKNRNCKLIIKVWSFLFLIFGAGLKILGFITESILNNFENFNLILFLKQLLIMVIGIYLFAWADKSITIRQQR